MTDPDPDLEMKNPVRLEHDEAWFVFVFFLFRNFSPFVLFFPTLFPGKVD